MTAPAKTAPQSSVTVAARPIATVIRRGAAPFGPATVLSRWEPGAEDLPVGEHVLYGQAALDAAVALERERCLRAAKTAVHSVPAERRFSADLLIHALDTALKA